MGAWAAGRGSFDFALVSAAVALEMDGTRIRQARVALGGVGPSLGVFPGSRQRSPEEASTRRNDFKIELMQRAIVRAVETAGARA